MVSGQWSVVSGQWSVVSGQWSVVSGQWKKLPFYTYLLISTELNFLQETFKKTGD